MEAQTSQPRPGVLPYLFLADYQRYPRDEIAGLQVAVGDQLAATTVRTNLPSGDPLVTKVCRRATPQDLAAYRARRNAGPPQKEPLVAIQFDKSVGPYRGPMPDRPADIAGFPPEIARKYVEGYATGGKDGTRVGSVAHYYVDRIADDVTLEEPEKPKPRAPRKPRSTPRRRRKRQRAAMDEEGAPEQK